jgi:hypothetical protein
MTRAKTAKVMHLLAYHFAIFSVAVRFALFLFARGHFVLVA